MRRIVFLSVALIVLTAVPSAAQQGEWRLTTRLTSLDLDVTTDSILDTSSEATADSSSLTAALEAQLMLSDGLGLSMSLTSAPFDFEGSGGDLDGRVLGEIWFTPVTLTMRYELQLRGGLQPYFGGGVNVVFGLFDDVEPALEAYDVTKMKIRPGFSWVVEGGLNYSLSNSSFVSLDLKYLDISADLDLENDAGDRVDQLSLEGSSMEIGLGIAWRW